MPANHLPVALIGNINVADARRSLGADNYAWRGLDNIKTISIHHWNSGYVVRADMTENDEVAEMRRIADFHRNQQKYLGYSYHFTVWPSQRIYYTGDVESIRYTVKGAQNAETLAIALPGDFTTAPPPDSQLDATRRLIAELRFMLNNAEFPVVPHSYYKTSSCPGATWLDWRFALETPNPALDPRSPEEIQLGVLWGLVQKLPDEDRLAGEAAIIALKQDLGLE